MRQIKFRFVENSGTPDVKIYDFTKEGVEECRKNNKDENYTTDEYFRLIFTSGFNNIKLIQFTGLLDKNGREIYEGDICTQTFDKKLEKGVVAMEMRLKQ